MSYAPQSATKTCNEKKLSRSVICQNHASVDGNKPAALPSPLVFLDMNGVTISDLTGRLYDDVISFASGKMHKNEFAEVLRSLSLQYYILR
jgi:prophage maintenance system killer protein